MKPELSTEIVRFDPAVLLRSDVATASNEDSETLVEALLRRFESEERADLQQERDQYWKLAHPQLPAQLRPYLLGEQGDDWARILAIEIAERCRLQEVDDLLADLALSSGTPDRIRKDAAYAVARIGRPAARSRLRPLLELDSVEDPNEDLKGCALRALWPDFISLDEILPHLQPPRNSRWLGAYETFLTQEFARSLRDEDLAPALRWIASLRYVPAVFPLRRLEDALLVRAWSYLDAAQVREAFAAVIDTRVDRTDFSPSDEKLERLITEDSARRRLVLNSLIRQEVDASVYGVAAAIVSRPPWAGSADISWLLDHLDEEQTPRTRARIAELVRMVLDTSDEQQVLATHEATERHPELKDALRWVFGPIPLDDPSVVRQREHFRRSQELQARTEARRAEIPPSRVPELLAEGRNGAAISWPLLCWDLSIDRQRLIREFTQTDLRDLPGWPSIDPAQRPAVYLMAQRYLLEWDPSVDGPPTRGVIVPRLLAGYRALRLLRDEAPQLLDNLRPAVWHRWADIVVCQPYQGEAEDAEAQQDLVTRAYAAAPYAVIAATQRRIDDENLGYGQFFGLHLLDNCWDDTLEQALLEKVRDPALRSKPLGQLLSILVERGGAEAIDLAASFIPTPLPRRGKRRERAIEAAQALLRRPDVGWPMVWAVIERDPSFGRAVLDTESLSGPDEALLAQLDEHQLGDLYLWLVRRARPRMRLTMGSGITPLTLWTSAILSELQGRGTDAAVQIVRRLMKKLPRQHEGLRWALRAAQESRRRKTWVPLSSEEVLHLTRRPSNRLVRSADDLLEATLEALRGFEAELQADLGTVIELWNERSEPVTGGGRVRLAWPKDEGRLSDAVVRHLRRALSPSGIVVNREVQVHRGNETDVHVDAPLHGRQGEPAATVRLVVEVKGSWHPELWDAMKTQLVDRYLGHGDANRGIYLVGWFACAKWNDRGDSRHRRSRMSIASSQCRLDRQAAELSNDTVRVRALVIDASLR
jgi:hypothetical protein